MCVGPPKPAEHLVLAALFFGDFILSLSKDFFVQAKESTYKLHQGKKYSKPFLGKQKKEKQTYLQL
jgi:hypothetical protein